MPAAESGGIVRRKTFLVAAILVFGYYCVSSRWSVYEVGRCLLGIALLWGPIVGLLYVTLYRSVEDPAVRLGLSYAGSYTLTTLIYFGLAVMNLEWFFPPVLFAAGAAAVWLGRHRLRTAPVHLPRLDSVLLTIVAASLVATIPYSPAATLTQSGDRILTGYRDHFYHVGLEYELSRHVPPSQASIRGGTPERAYHLFSHLTTVLIARFTGQREMLRAHGVYHYAAITVLICLALYGIGFLLTGAVTGGYVCAFLPFLLTIAMRPIMPNALGYFFYTLLPHATSTVFPTLGTSPQMFSGIAVVYGVLLGIAAILRVPKAARRPWVLPLLCGLMTASLLRFRIHCWIATLPAFLVFASVMWYRSRHRMWIVSAAAAIALSALLFREMSLPAYMRGTTEIHLGLNRLSEIPFYTIWPFSAFLQQELPKFVGGATLSWTWQIVCLSGFTIWNILGLPLCAGLVLVPAIMKRSQALGYCLCTIGIILLSMFMATCLSVGYDRYSFPGQLVYHFGWYALPLEGVGVTWLIMYVQSHEFHGWVLWTIIAALSAMVSALLGTCFAMGDDGAATPGQFDYHFGWYCLTLAAVGMVWLVLYVQGRPSQAWVLWTVIAVLSGIASARSQREFTATTLGPGVMITQAGWDAFHYLRDSTPDNAIVLSSSPLDRNFALVSGLGGRSGYSDMMPNPVDDQAVKLNPADNRSNKLRAMEEAQTPLALCSVVASTPITHILEQSSNRLMRNLPCLRKLWTGRDGATAVWQVIHR